MKIFSLRRFGALGSAAVLAVTLYGCAKETENNPVFPVEESSQVVIVPTPTPTVLPEVVNKQNEIYSVESLFNGEKRKILLSEEPHLYESMFEKTDTKVYLADENGTRLSNNFDELSRLCNFSYLTTGGVLLGKWEKVETDKQYDYFVGVTLLKDFNGNSLGPSVTLLDSNGIELCTFNGYFKALVGNIVVIQDYFEGENTTVGVPDTYLYNYITGEKSEKYDYVKLFKYKSDQNEETSYLIGVNLPYKWRSLDKKLYSFYDTNLKVVATASEDEIEDWYTSNGDWYSFYNAGGNYDAYFKSVYQSINAERQLIRVRDLEIQD